MRLNKNVLKWGGFGVVLLVALTISGWSMATLALEFFGLPAWLAIPVSVATDGAAIYTGILASEYNRTEDSGFMARLITLALVAMSAWLNWQHAVLMGLGMAGQIFLALPPVIAWLLFEQFLKFEHRQELRRQNKVAQSLPVFGRMAWLRYPTKTFKAQSRVILYRLEQTGRLEIVESKPVKQPAEKPVRMVKQKTKPVEIGPVVEEPLTEVLLPHWMPADKKASFSQIASLCVENGVTDIAKATDYASALKGEAVHRGTMQRALHRAKTNNQTGLYL